MSGSTPGQNLALHESTIVRAGAGAGKTTALIQRFIDYAVQFKTAHGRWPRIILTTFTKKATHEIKERLFQKALEGGNVELFSYINSPSQVQITTIHGLLSSFLIENGLEMGLRPQISIGDQRLLNQEKRNLLRKMLLENPEWSQILEVWRFSELLTILDEWSTEHLQNPTFSPWPAENMAGEVREILLSHAIEIENLVRVISETTSNKSWLDWCDIFPRGLKQDEAAEVVERLLRWKEGRGRRPQFRSDKPPFEENLKDKLLEQLEELDEILGLKILDPEFQRKLDEVHGIFDPLAQKFSQEFFNLRLQKGLLSFNDLEVFSFRMMREHPGYVQQFSKHWDYWLIDEYQDTSPLQVDLLRELIGASPHYVVGDPQQSIYLFRGARVEVFDAKMQELAQKKQKVIEQLTNYRSRKEILLFINYYFSYFKDRFASMEVGSKESMPEETAVDVVPVGEDETEVQRAKDYIIHLLSRGVRHEEICVLSATHQSLAQLSDLLTQNQIDFQVHSQGKFFERDEVIDALTVLKFLSNPHDNKNLVGLLRSPWFYLSAQKIQTFCKPGSYWLHAMKSSWAQESVLQELQSYLLRMKVSGVVDTFKNILLEKGLFQSAGSLDGSGQREANLWKLVLHLMAAEKKSGFSLIEYIRRIEENQSLVEGEMEGDAAPFVEPQKVQLMTIHASKGLQFANVILLGYGRDQQKTRTQVWAHRSGHYSLSLRDDETGEMVPSWLSYRLRKELNRREGEEYLRLLYVAFTRAKSKIALFELPKKRKSSWQGIFPGNWTAINMSAENKGLKPLIQTLSDLPKDSKYQNANVATKAVAVLNPYQGGNTKKHLESASVTGQLGPTVKVKHWSPESFQKIQKGVDFHRIVEILKYEVQSPAHEKLDVDFKRAVNFIRNYKAVPLLKLIQDGQVEWGFTVKQDTKIIRGQIDLWCWSDDTLWVIDYKTGKSGDATALAFEQVRTYAKALQQIFPDYQNKKVRLLIIYPFEEKIEEQTFS